MRQGLPRLYAAFAWIFLGAVVVQYFLAGVGIFVVGDAFGIHALFGLVILLLGVITLGLAVAAHLPRQTIQRTALLPLLVVLQVVLVEVGRVSFHLVGALHVVNALAVFAVAAYVALRAGTVQPVRQPLAEPVR